MAGGMDKGAALRALAAERDASAVLFAGDDLGDLAAYDAIEALRKEGIKEGYRGRRFVVPLIRSPRWPSARTRSSTARTESSVW